MISIRFIDFRNGDYDNHGECHQLYLVRDEHEIYYIGISRTGIWYRWFDPFLGHFAKHSPIAERITWYGVRSNEWRIELWTLEDCLDFLKPERTRYFKSSGRAKKKLADWDLITCEARMIRKLNPFSVRHFLA